MDTLRVIETIEKYKNIYGWAIVNTEDFADVRMLGDYNEVDKTYKSDATLQNDCVVLRTDTLLRIL